MSLMAQPIVTEMFGLTFLSKVSFLIYFVQIRRMLAGVVDSEHRVNLSQN